MSEMIIYQGNKPIIEPEAMQLFAEAEKKMKELKKKEDELKARLLKEMEEKNIPSIEVETDTYNAKFTYIAPTTRESLDTKALQRDFGSICSSYMKESPVKASVRVTIK